MEDGSNRWSHETLAALTRSARAAGRGAVVSGRWLVDTVVEMAPHLPIRDVDKLSEHHGGLTGARLARSMVQASGKTSAAIGGAAGGLMTVQELSLAGALAIPFELAAETALVVLVELKLVAELHNVAARPLPGGPRHRTAAAVQSWLSGRAVADRLCVVPGPPGARNNAKSTSEPDDEELLSPGARAHLGRALKQRFTRNLTSVAPLFSGAAVAAWINRKATMTIGRSLTRDLGLAA